MLLIYIKIVSSGQPYRVDIESNQYAHCGIMNITIPVIHNLLAGHRSILVRNWNDIFLLILCVWMFSK